jgi:flagellar hook protein FlgE
MNTLSAISLSGMQAAQTALGAAAHNIANLPTPDFRRQQVQASATAGGGVSVSLSQAPQEGAALETDVVGLLAAKNQFLANLVVFKTSDQMTRSLLDTQA